MYCGAEISEIVPFTCLLKNSNKELKKSISFFFNIKDSMVPGSVFFVGCDKPLLMLKCTDIPD